MPTAASPRLISATLDGKTASDGIYLNAGGLYTAEAVLEDPDKDPLSFIWEIKPESTDLGDGGDLESTPPSMPELIEHPSEASITILAPETSGAYRLFIYAFDGMGHAAHANIPFYVND